MDNDVKLDELEHKLKKLDEKIYGGTTNFLILRELIKINRKIDKLFKELDIE